MKKERSCRLRLLQCFIDSSPLVWKEDECGNGYDPQTKSVVESWRNVDDILKGLRYQEVISKFYTEKCLLVDFWYLTKTTTFTPGANRNCPTAMDVEGRTLFQIVFQSLLDLKSGRPCDLGIWKKDFSPDFDNCTYSYHICWNDAEDYLHNLPTEAESYMGLSNGYLNGLITEIKKDRIFKIPSFILDNHDSQNIESNCLITSS